MEKKSLLDKARYGEGREAEGGGKGESGGKERGEAEKRRKESRRFSCFAQVDKLARGST